MAERETEENYLQFRILVQVVVVGVAGGVLIVVLIIISAVYLAFNNCSTIK